MGDSTKPSSSRADDDQCERASHRSQDAYTLGRVIHKLGTTDMEAVRHLIVDLWTKSQLDLYRKTFEPSLPDSALSAFHHRVNWLVRWITEYDTMSYSAFPDHWFVAENVVLAICLATTEELKSQLNSIGSTTITPTQVVDPLLQVRRLEEYLVTHFTANANSLQFDRAGVIHKPNHGNVRPNSLIDYVEIIKSSFQGVMYSAFVAVLAIPAADYIDEMQKACFASIRDEKWTAVDSDGIYPSAKLILDAYQQCYRKLDFILPPNAIVGIVDHYKRGEADLEHFEMCWYLTVLNKALECVDKSYHHPSNLSSKQDDCVNMIKTVHYCNVQYANLLSKCFQADGGVVALASERIACVARQSETIIKNANLYLLRILDKRVIEFFAPIRDATKWHKPVMNDTESKLSSLNAIIQRLLASLPPIAEADNVRLYFLLRPLFSSLARRVAYEFETAVTNSINIDVNDVKQLYIELKETLKLLPLPTAANGDIRLGGDDWVFAEDLPELFKSVDSFLSLSDVPTDILIKALRQRGVSSIDCVKLSDMDKAGDSPSTSVQTPIVAVCNASVHANHNQAIRSAAENGQLDIVQSLYSRGADIHVFNDEAIRMASRNGHLEVVKFLRVSGGNIHALDNYALRWASENGHLEVVKYLYSNGADIHADQDYALRWAAARGRLEVVKFLHLSGADIHARSDSALRWAANDGHLEVVKFLQLNGANIHANDESAIICAAARGYLEVVKFLYSNGANVHISDDSALVYATRNGHVNVVNFIQSLPPHK